MASSSYEVVLLLLLRLVLLLLPGLVLLLPGTGAAAVAGDWELVLLLL